MRPFANTGYDTLFRDPIWGGLSLGASKSRFDFLVDSFNCWCEKNTVRRLKVLFQ